MGSNYGQDYHVDIVFCIDCTETMDNILNIIKARALSFYADVQRAMQYKDKRVSRLRVRVVAFRDYLAYDQERRKGSRGNYPMLVTDFFTLPEEAGKLEISVRSLYPIGGGDEPEDGLEALAYAIRSDWDQDYSTKHRNIIVLWTDADAHELGFGWNTSQYPRGMARNFSELTMWWGNRGKPGYMRDQAAKRLILFAPDSGYWNTISQLWDNVIHHRSKAGNHLNEVDYETIISCIANSI